MDEKHMLLCLISEHRLIKKICHQVVANAWQCLRFGENTHSDGDVFGPHLLPDVAVGDDDYCDLGGYWQDREMNKSSFPGL
jgi:hypothetical protein